VSVYRFVTYTASSVSEYTGPSDNARLLEFERLKRVVAELKKLTQFANAERGAP
jgi:hypothetical protein